MGKGGSRSLFHKSSPMIYAKHFKTLFDDLPRESMEYGPKVHPFYESRNPEGPILGEIRLMKHAPRTAPTGGEMGGLCRRRWRP